MARRVRNDPLGQAGWLFADLLLGLAMLYFAVGTSAAPPIPPPTPTPTATPLPVPTATPGPTDTPVPTPTPTPTPVPPARTCLDQQVVRRTVRFNAGALDAPTTRDAALTDLQNALAAAFAPEIAAGRAAGVVLTFGGARGVTPERGNQYAAYVNRALRTVPGFGAATQIDDLHDLGVAVGDADVWVLFLSPC
jgi:hypothetical protein